MMSIYTPSPPSPTCHEISNLPLFPEALLITTIWPFLFRIMWGRTALVREIVPSTFVFSTGKTTSKSQSIDKPICKIPALFTKKSICNLTESTYICHKSKNKSVTEHIYMKICCNKLNQEPLPYVCYWGIQIKRYKRLNLNSSQIIMLWYPSRDFSLSASPHLSLLTPLQTL